MIILNFLSAENDFHLKILFRELKRRAHEALLPGEAGLVPQLQLHAAALGLHYAGVVWDTDAPEQEPGGGGHDVATGVPAHPTQQLGVVHRVPEPGTGLQDVDSVDDLLLGHRHDEVLPVSPDLEQAVLAALLREALHQVAVDVGRQLLYHGVTLTDVAI